MRRTVWDDLREDARRFARQYPETGHTLLHVPDRDAEGAAQIDVERASEGPNHFNSRQAEQAKALAREISVAALAESLQREPRALADLLASAMDTESRLRETHVGGLSAQLSELRQRVIDGGTGFVAEWLWGSGPKPTSINELEYELTDREVVFRVSPAGEDGPWVGWNRLCRELWKLICGRVGELLPNAVTIDPVMAPSIGSDPNVIDSSLVMHWLAWSAEVTALRAKVGWRLSLRPTDESRLAEFKHAPQTFTQAPPFEVGHPVVPSMPSNKPWLKPAGWWHSTIQPAGAGLVATIDWFRKTAPEADARVVGAAEADPPSPGSERVQPSCEEALRPSLQPAHLRAAASFEWVCKARPDLIPKLPKKYAVEQWEYIRDHDCPAYEDDGKPIKIPGYESWQRQIRGGLRDPEGPKTSPRAGREHGSSIAPHAQL